MGIGIVGKEGKQASLAADFSINEFEYLGRLLLWHGRNSYKRTATLAQFVIHRGVIIAIIQAVFSSIFYYAAVPIFQGWLQVGYATLYTMFPVFSMVLDQDISEEMAFMFPELYQDLQKGRALNNKTFWIWIVKSIYQGGVIMIGSMFLFEENFINIVAISFTALILSELANVALQVNRWHYLMVISELVSMALYFGSMFVFPSYFNLNFVLTWTFWYKSLLITGVSCIPVSLLRWIKRRYMPSAHLKLQEMR